MIRKIISGGQTGADLGGLKAAKKLGITTGGMAPKGFKTELGSNPGLASIYGLTAAHTEDYSYRTAANVRASHTTIVFATKANSPGTKLTVKTCEAARKSFTVINPFDNNAAQMLTTFLAEINARYGGNLIVNIAGNRESKSKGIELRVEELLVEVLGTTV